MRQNRTFTVAADPINVATGFTTAADRVDSKMANRVFIQMLTAVGAGLGYVLDGVPWGSVPSIAVANDITAELSAASATGPGGNYGDTAHLPGTEIDLSKLWVHGAHAGDKIKVSYDLPV